MFYHPSALWAPPLKGEVEKSQGDFSGGGGAGTSARLNTLNTSRATWRQVFEVNLFATLWLARGLVDELAAAHGAIVNVTSIAGHAVHPFAGSAYATSIGRWIMLAVLIFSARKVLEPYFRGFTRHAFAWRAHGHHLKLGMPIGAHHALELSIFTTVALLMGRLGVNELAGHQITLNLSAISFMVPAGVGAAASTRVGNAIGRGDMPGARRAAVVCLGLGAGVMSLFGLLFALAPRLSNDAFRAAMRSITWPRFGSFGASVTSSPSIFLCAASLTRSR